MPDLLEFTKNLLGFYGVEADIVLGPLVLAAEQYLKNAGVKVPVAPVAPVEPGEPSPEEEAEYEAALALYQSELAAYERETALYNVAVATRVKILHDGDLKGDLERTLTSIILQIKDYAGGEVI
jgi:hypothetical protein